MTRAVNEKDRLRETFEEMKSATSQLKQKMEEVLSEKENTITSAEDVIRRLKQDNDSLQSRLLKCGRELKADKKCVVELLEKRKEMSAEIESLSKDKEILEVSLKDMDLYPVKLKNTQGKNAVINDLILLTKTDAYELLIKRIIIGYTNPT